MKKTPYSHQARRGTFTLLLPLLSHTPTSNVRYISFQRNLQLKIHLSSYQFRITTQVVWCPKKPVWLGAKYAWNDAVCARRIVSLAYPFTFWGELRWDVVCVHFRTRRTASLPVGGLPLGNFEFLEVCEASQVTFLNFFIPLQLTGMRLFLFSFSSAAHYAPS